MDTLRRVTWFNRIAMSLLVVSTVTLMLRGRWQSAVIVGTAIAILTWFILRSLRGRGSDADRVNSAQPFDERDAAATTWGFAVVGQFALLGALAMVLYRLAMGQPEVVPQTFELIVLSLVWGAANTFAVRRG